MLSISVVICCHNSSHRLAPTLIHLAQQKISVGCRWEIIIIDNCSTDDTITVAQQTWQNSETVPLRIINENRLGAGFARVRGLNEARYDLVCFVDDDLWIAPDYLAVAENIMSQHPQVGGVGGVNEGVCEVTPPYWYERFSYVYAVGVQGEKVGDITETRGFLYGAGLVIRRTAWQQVVDTLGLTSLLCTGRQGARTCGGGEDVEICYALRYIGWRLWYDPDLKAQHFLPAQRLQWKYVCDLFRGYGEVEVLLDVYRTKKLMPITGKSMWWRALTLSLLRLMAKTGIMILVKNKTVKRLISKWKNAPLFLRQTIKTLRLKGYYQWVLYVYWERGYLSSLFKNKKKYVEGVEAFR